VNRLTSLALLTLAACGERHAETSTQAEEPSRRIEDLEGLPGVECGSPLMVVVTRADTTTFCIDRFEARLGSGEVGTFHQGGDDDLLVTTNGSTTAASQVALGVTPRADVSWYQSVSACANAGKRLCTTAEWERACRGDEGFAYPYGDNVDHDACVGFFSFPEQVPAMTGSLSSCGTSFGVYDMSGNVEEWTFDAVERLRGSGELDDRAVRGGGFRSNYAALACAGPEFHEPPGSHDTDRGFRCCADGPL
jgi:hypothetical protein